MDNIYGYFAKDKTKSWIKWLLVIAGVLLVMFVFGELYLFGVFFDLIVKLWK